MVAKREVIWKDGKATLKITPSPKETTPAGGGTRTTPSGGVVFDPSMPESERAKLRAPATQAAVEQQRQQQAQREAAAARQEFEQRQAQRSRQAQQIALEPGQTIKGGVIEVGQKGTVKSVKYYIEQPPKADLQADLQMMRYSFTPTPEGKTSQVPQKQVIEIERKRSRYGENLVVDVAKDFGKYKPGEYAEQQRLKGKEETYGTFGGGFLMLQAEKAEEEAKLTTAPLKKTYVVAGAVGLAAIAQPIVITESFVRDPLGTTGEFVEFFVRPKKSVEEIGAGLRSSPAQTTGALVGSYFTFEAAGQLIKLPKRVIEGKKSQTLTVKYQDATLSPEVAKSIYKEAKGKPVEITVEEFGMVAGEGFKLKKGDIYTAVEAQIRFEKTTKVIAAEEALAMGEPGAFRIELRAIEKKTGPWGEQLTVTDPEIITLTAKELGSLSEGRVFEVKGPTKKARVQASGDIIEIKAERIQVVSPEKLIKELEVPKKLQPRAGLEVESIGVVGEVTMVEYFRPKDLAPPDIGKSFSFKKSSSKAAKGGLPWEPYKPKPIPKGLPKEMKAYIEQGQLQKTKPLLTKQKVEVSLKSTTPVQKITSIQIKSTSDAAAFQSFASKVKATSPGWQVGTKKLGDIFGRQKKKKKLIFYDETQYTSRLPGTENIFGQRLNVLETKVVTIPTVRTTTKTKLKSKPKLDVIQTQLQSQGSKTLSLTKTKTGVKTTSITKTKQSTAVDQITGTQTTTDTLQLQNVKSGFTRGLPKITDPGGPPKFKIFERPDDTKDKLIRSSKAKSMRLEYRPTLYSSFTDRIGKSTKTGVFSGLGLRPLRKKKKKRFRI